MPGDDPAVIASGPTVADLTTAVDALKVLDFYGIAIPRCAARAAGIGELETLKAGDPRLAAARSVWSPARAGCSKRRRPRQLASASRR